MDGISWITQEECIQRHVLKGTYLPLAISLSLSLSLCSFATRTRDVDFVVLFSKLNLTSFSSLHLSIHRSHLNH